ncbi:hypothetical protein ABXN37_09665 [Piscinibacter sakaiensis]|uniref:hypothetical protein n=1 Tax=Piscinibacter sakaiensis TaxID=1547922 RepID=UPI003729BED1
MRARLVPKPPPAAADALLLTVLALLRAEPPRYAPHTLVDQAVAAARLRRSASPAFVNAVLRRALRERADWPGWLAGDPVAVHEHPRWWIERLQADWPAQWEALLAADAVQAPMTLRPNLARGTLADYQARLAPGGKTAQLLEQSPVPLDLLALDRDPQRLRRVEETLQRLGLRAGLQAADAGDPAAWWDGRPFADVRWLRRASDIPALAATQARLLEALWPLLAPGGRLVYCTCSVFREEGQDRIDAFLQQHPEALVPVMPASPGHLLPLADNRPEQSPAAVAPWDGFFVALLTRRGPA